MTFSVQHIVSLFYCVFVWSPALHNIFHTPMAQYALFVLNVSLNISQPTNLCRLLVWDLFTGWMPFLSFNQQCRSTGAQLLLLLFNWPIFPGITAC